MVTKYEASGLPPGINLSMLVPGEMVLCGTPTNQASGTYNFSVTGYFGDSLSSASASLTMTRTINVINNSGSNSSADCSIPGNVPPPLQLAGGTTANVVTETGKYFEIKYENGKEHSGGGYNITWDNQPDNVVVEGYIVGIKIKGTPTTVGTYNYTLTSNAQYNCSTAPVTGTIIIQEASTSGTSTPTDTTPPIITLNGQSSITLSVGDTYTEQGATANDNIDGNLTNNIVITGSVDTSSPGTYTVTYTVSDALNNTSSIARTITVQASTANTSQAFTINVSANNASNYILNGTDRNGQVSGNDPTVTIKVGDTVNFAVNAPGHPFYLKTVQGTGTANTISGVTNNGTTNGTVSWTPSQTGTYYYICSLHGGMIGTISVN